MCIAQCASRYARSVMLRAVNVQSASQTAQTSSRYDQGLYVACNGARNVHERSDAALV